MKKLIKNTVLVVVAVMGLSLSSCKKDNPQPDYTTTEGLITISTKADSVLVSMTTPEKEGSEFKVYKNEPKSIKIKGFDPRTYNIGMTISVYNGISTSTIMPSYVKVIDHKNREVSPSHSNEYYMHYSTGFVYHMYYYFTFTE